MPVANIGTRYALFEAVHRTAPEIKGKGVANSIAPALLAPQNAGAHWPAGDGTPNQGVG